MGWFFQIHPLLGASGVVQKFWLPCLGPEGTNNGWVRLSVELVSKKLAEAKPAGQGRTEPNAWPKLPEPQGRVALIGVCQSTNAPSGGAPFALAPGELMEAVIIDPLSGAVDRTAGFQL